MNSIKKLLSVVLSLTFVLMLCVPANAADTPDTVVKEDNSNTLRFGDDGKFKVMYICDVQDDYPIEEATLTLLGEALDADKPDVVIFGGDNTVCSGTEIYAQLVKPFTDRNIPFTLVFGNHDNESAQVEGEPHYSKEWQLSQYQLYDGCLAVDEVPEMHGCATHSLPVYSSDGSKVSFNLWMFDSGDYVANGYDCVRKDQIEWYKNKSLALEQANGGKKVPSLAFQHIIVNEVYKAMFFKLPFALGMASRNITDGSVYSLIPNLFKLNGIMFEAPCPSMDNDGQWDAFVQRGDVLGCAFGHDHINDFICNYKGVDMIQTPAVTYNSYGNDLLRGVRMLVIDENNPWEYETYTITAAELAMREGSKIPEVTGDSTFVYTLRYYFCKFLMMLMNIG